MNRYRSFVISVLVALVALLVTSTVAMAQGNNTSTASAPVSATITAAITIVHSAHLNFGMIVAGTGAGTVVLSAAASPTRTASGCTLGNGTDLSAAAFSVAGTPGGTYAITLPGDSDVTIDDAGAGDHMHITAFTSNPSGTGTLSGGGAQTLYVGGTLNIGAAQLAGEYTGTFDVTVTYN